MRYGYERKLEQVKELNLEAWRRTRMTAYTAAKPHLKNQNLDIWEFMPLPGDPTEEDMKSMHDVQARQLQLDMDEATKLYRQWGLDIPDIKFTA